MARSTAGSNLTLAALLAFLSYVPFEYVAKSTLVVCVFLFVVDPFPPTSRLVSLIATLVVAFLARAERRLREEEDKDENENELADFQQAQIEKENTKKVPPSKEKSH